MDIRISRESQTSFHVVKNAHIIDKGKPIHFAVGDFYLVSLQLLKGNFALRGYKNPFCSLGDGSWHTANGSRTFTSTIIAIVCVDLSHCVKINFVSKRVFHFI
eukprot:Pompholyxophrys_punicea_v1_NODE_824_length_1239_cov_8.625000.p3 type:complete len:103 gc:universal NODE_824_length_1239_cov_8.625000:426-118(-)